jgi:hypothetical protein
LKKRSWQVSLPSSMVAINCRRGRNTTSHSVTTPSTCAMSPSRVSASFTMRVSSS